MKYTKIPKSLDGLMTPKGLYLVEGELLTEKECAKWGISPKLVSLLPVVEIPKTKVFWSFGVRMEVRF